MHWDKMKGGICMTINSHHPIFCRPKSGCFHLFVKFSFPRRPAQPLHPTCATAHAAACGVAPSGGVGLPRRAKHGAPGRAGAAGDAAGGVERLRQRAQQRTRGSGDPGGAWGGNVFGVWFVVFWVEGDGLVGFFFIVGDGIAVESVGCVYSKGSR